MSHMILRGPRGIGKTTLVHRLLEETGARPGGYVTRKSVPDKDGIEQIHIFPAAVPEGKWNPSEENCVGACKEGQLLYCRSDVFDTLGVSYLQDISGTDILLMDELGFLESDALVFQQAVLQALGESHPVLAVVKEKEFPFLEQVCCHPRTQVWRITQENRTQLIPELRSVLIRLMQK